MRLGILLASAVLVSAAATAVSAQVINVNFHMDDRGKLGGTSYASGVAPAAYTGSTWNDFVQDQYRVETDLGELKDSNGNSTGITLKLAGANANNWFIAADAVTLDGEPVPPATTPRMLAQDIWAQNSDILVQLANLNPAQTYDLYVVSYHNYHGNVSGGTVTIGSQSQAASYATYTPLQDGVNYVSFHGVAPQADGSLTIDVTNAHNYAILNGFQIVGVPEPASLSLLGLGSVLMLRRRSAR